MPGNMSVALQDGLADLIFRSRAYTADAVLAIALASGIPTASQGANAFSEWQNAGGYVRQTLVPSTSNWAYNAASGAIVNMVAVTFPVCTAPGGWVSGIMLLNSSGYGVGTPLAWGAVTTPKYYDVNDQATFPSGSLAFTFS